MQMKTEKIEYYSECVAFFMDKYQAKTGVKYSFEGKDGKALKSILSKIEKIKGEGNTLDLFRHIIQNLPKWDLENALSLTSINSRFNVIIAGITKQKKVSDGYKEQIITDIFR
jgi:hypothetical protein